MSTPLTPRIFQYIDGFVSIILPLLLSSLVQVYELSSPYREIPRVDVLLKSKTKLNVTIDNMFVKQTCKPLSTTHS